MIHPEKTRQLIDEYLEDYEKLKSNSEETPNTERSNRVLNDFLSDFFFSHTDLFLNKLDELEGDIIRAIRETSKEIGLKNIADIKIDFLNYVKNEDGNEPLLNHVELFAVMQKLTTRLLQSGDFLVEIQREEGRRFLFTISPIKGADFVERYKTILKKYHGQKFNR